MTDITTYSIESACGDAEPGEWDESEYEEAKGIAREQRARVIERTYVFDDSAMVDDFTVTGGEWERIGDESGDDEQRDLEDGYYAQAGPEGQGWSATVIDSEGAEVWGGVAATREDARKLVHEWACEHISGWRRDQ